MCASVFIFQLALAIIAFPFYILHFLGLWNPICKRLFPQFMIKFAVSYNRNMDPTKKDLFSNLCDFQSSTNGLKLLEIGCGTGVNFKFYPRGSRVTCVDLNPNFEKHLLKSQEENDHLVFERFLVASADNMNQVPDGSMDVVVCTLLACSVSDTPKVLEEVCRVLRPGGAFYFLEHVASPDDSSYTSFVQKVLNPTWKLLIDGCHLTRTTWKDLEKAKFSKLNLRHMQGPNLFMPLKPHIVGYATK
ncbi:putative methyltransferase-like protein 7A [Bombina bombina]|uniref:putative methyltransferase-like protein 7A n=1 Tax=Bombina bombina TaxID=8345 RepID=UPI00235AA7A3|nr:putative methyltransferase-like protein 7A [Bombina bombina]